MRSYRPATRSRAPGSRRGSRSRAQQRSWRSPPSTPTVPNSAGLPRFSRRGVRRYALVRWHARNEFEWGLHSGQGVRPYAPTTWWSALGSADRDAALLDLDLVCLDRGSGGPVEQATVREAEDRTVPR